MKPFTFFKKILSLPKLQSERGSLILISYFAMVVLLGVGASLLMLTANESRQAERQKLNSIAFHIAEAGLERGLYELRNDFVEGGDNPSWIDEYIGDYKIGPDTENFYEIPFENNGLNGGEYAVELMNVAGADDDIWVRSTGEISGVSHTIDVYARMVNCTPWEYAIFAGEGATGSIISGHVDVHGSVIILGDGLEDGDVAIDMIGSSKISNSYEGLSSGLRDKVPALNTVNIEGEDVETLNATLRVKKGTVGVSGHALIGESQETGDAYKETMDGVYVTDGYSGNKGASRVYSDNGTSNAYDLGDTVSFPSFSDSYKGYDSYDAYLQDHALVISDVSDLNTFSSIKPNSSFSYSNANGSISMDGSGNLTVSGIVYLDGGGISMTKQGSKKTITYSGTGSVYASEDININVNVITSGSNSFPSNVVGFMTPGNINVGTVTGASNLEVMGAFYAEGTITLEKQTTVVGSIVSNSFDMGTNVPSIYQVPELASNLPPGMIGSTAKWYLVVAWIKQ